MARPYQVPELVSAVFSRQPQQLAQALENTDNVDERDTDQRTALIHAAINGDLAAVTTLLEHGADPHARDYIDWTALHYALQGLHTDVVDRLLATGIEVRIDALGYYNADRVPPSARLDRAKVIAQQLCKADGQHPEGLTAPLAPTNIKLRIGGKKLSMNLLNGGDYSLSPSKPTAKQKKAPAPKR